MHAAPSLVMAIDVDDQRAAGPLDGGVDRRRGRDGRRGGQRGEHAGECHGQPNSHAEVT
jgi:hypothetical protein